jgi:hypothetical protein
MLGVVSPTLWMLEEAQNMFVYYKWRKRELCKTYERVGAMETKSLSKPNGSKRKPEPELRKFRFLVRKKMCLVQASFLQRDRRRMKKKKGLEVLRNGDSRGEERGVSGFKVKKARS